MVRIRATGRRHTDLELIESGLRIPFSLVTDHEAVGVQEVIGSALNIVGLRLGSPVMLIGCATMGLLRFRERRWAPGGSKGCFVVLE